MASSDFLRKNLNQHAVKNSLSKGMDGEIDTAVRTLIARLGKRHPTLAFTHKKKMLLSEIIEVLSPQHPEPKGTFASVMPESFIRPDGGFLYCADGNGVSRLILVSEIKRQGTNDKRLQEGLVKQPAGNAIERLGKNLIGIRTLFKTEPVIPFVCFGSGYDFRPGSTILDRVVTMNEFYPLNEIFVEKKHLPFEPVSMFFRYEDWSGREMLMIMDRIAEAAIKAYFPSA